MRRKVFKTFIAGGAMLVPAAIATATPSISVIAQGTPTDTSGDVASGYDGYLFSIVPDAGMAVSSGQRCVAAAGKEAFNGLFLGRSSRSGISRGYNRRHAKPHTL